MKLRFRDLMNSPTFSSAMLNPLPEEVVVWRCTRGGFEPDLLLGSALFRPCGGFESSSETLHEEETL